MNYFFLVSKKDHIDLSDSTSYQFIRNNADAIRLAIEDGFKYKSTYQYENEPIPQTDKNVKHGNLIISVTNKGYSYYASEMAKITLTQLRNRFQIDDFNSQLWINPDMSIDIEIPQELYSNGEGDYKLPLIHFVMARDILGSCFPRSRVVWSNIDISYYAINRVKLILMDSVANDEGKYRIPVDHDIFYSLYPSHLAKLVMKPECSLNLDTASISKNKMLEHIFQVHKFQVEVHENGGYSGSELDTIEEVINLLEEHSIVTKSGDRTDNDQHDMIDSAVNNVMYDYQEDHDRLWDNLF